MDNFVGLYTRASFVTYNFYAAKLLGINCSIVLDALGKMVNWTKDSFSLDRNALSEKTLLGRGAVNTALRHLRAEEILHMTRQGYPCKWRYTLDTDLVIKIYLGDGTRKRGM